MKLTALLAALLLAGCSAAAQPATSAAPITLSGSGPTTTAPMAWSGAYRVAYSFQGDSAFLAELGDPATGHPVTLIVTVLSTAPKQGTTNIYGLSGRLFVHVLSPGPWKLTFTPSP